MADYKGHEKEYWLARHRQKLGSILAVGRRDATETVNQQEYRVARDQFCRILRKYGGDLSTGSVLDLGYGHGHYAVACHGLGVRSYTGLDFASSIHPDIHGYKFLTRDIATSQSLGVMFNIIICIDVIFHIVDDEKFDCLLSNVDRHLLPGGVFVVTGVFKDHRPGPHVRHRPMSAFGSLGLTIAAPPVPWRDNAIAVLSKGL